MRRSRFMATVVSFFVGRPRPKEPAEPHRGDDDVQLLNSEFQVLSYDYPEPTDGEK